MRTCVTRSICCIKPRRSVSTSVSTHRSRRYRIRRKPMAHDLLIKNAKICDGTGAPAYGGSVAITEGQITAVGQVSGTARREINADGLGLAPSFIDIHTHYDGQNSWEPLLARSC